MLRFRCKLYYQRMRKCSHYLRSPTCRSSTITSNTEQCQITNEQLKELTLLQLRTSSELPEGIHRPFWNVNSYFLGRNSTSYFIYICLYYKCTLKEHLKFETLYVSACSKAHRKMTEKGGGSSFKDSFHHPLQRATETCTYCLRQILSLWNYYKCQGTTQFRTQQLTKTKDSKPLARSSLSQMHL